MTSLKSALFALVAQQEQTSALMRQFMQIVGDKKSTDSTPIRHSHIPVSDLPKFSESILPDESFRYLGTSSVRDLSDTDRVIVRAFKFISFRNRFKKLTSLIPESVRLQHLYCCLTGVAQDRAIVETISSSDELLERLGKWYASAADPGALEDILREKLETSFPFQNEPLSNYILRFSQYFRYAQEVLPEFSYF